MEGDPLIVSGKVARKQAKQMISNLQSSEVWYDQAGKYKVVRMEIRGGMRMGEEGSIWLSIRMRDGSKLRDWSEFQQIKNDLCGKEREAVEIYPAESRLHDTDNVYHLFVIPEGHRVTYGWHQRDVT